MSAEAAELLLYGIVPAAAPLPELPAGVGGAPLHCWREGPLAALAAAAPAPQLLNHPQLADVLAFEQAVAAVHAHCDVLPARFGCILASPAALAAHLRARQERYLHGLARVAGCAEMGARLALREMPPAAAAPPSDASSGAGYLRARQAHYAERERQTGELARLAAQLQEALAPLCRESHVPPPRPGQAAHALTVAFLVPRPQCAQLRDAVADWQPRLPARLTALGPWPPFSFTPAPDDDEPPP